jgi:hypothetical protein
MMMILMMMMMMMSYPELHNYWAAISITLPSSSPTSSAQLDSYWLTGMSARISFKRTFLLVTTTWTATPF